MAQQQNPILAPVAVEAATGGLFGLYNLGKAIAADVRAAKERRRAIRTTAENVQEKGAVADVYDSAARGLGVGAVAQVAAVAGGTDVLLNGLQQALNLPPEVLAMLTPQQLGYLHLAQGVASGLLVLAAAYAKYKAISNRRL